MNIRTEKTGKILVVNVNEPKFTNTHSADFKEKIENLINEGNNYILINLDKVKYMDSAGLGAVISCYNYLTDTLLKNSESGKFSICSLNESVEYLFSMLRLNGIIDIYNNSETACSEMEKK